MLLPLDSVSLKSLSCKSFCKFQLLHGLSFVRHTDRLLGARFIARPLRVRIIRKSPTGLIALFDWNPADISGFMPTLIYPMPSQCTG